jgi:hypothetical protein
MRIIDIRNDLSNQKKQLSHLKTTKKNQPYKKLKVI